MDYQPIRIYLTAFSNPPAQLVDGSTDLIPQGVKGADFAFDVGIFSTNRVSVDLDNLVFIRADLLPAPIPNQDVYTNFTYADPSPGPFPTVPPAPLFSSVVYADDITGKIDNATWGSGTAQNARFVFTNAQTQTLNLIGQDAGRFFINVWGLTETGQKIVYGSGPVAFYDVGMYSVSPPINPTMLIALTSFTGGGANSLDGLPTAGGEYPIRSIQFVSTGTPGPGGTLLNTSWELRAGTFAEDAEAGFVRPDDYATGTNEKVWCQIG